MTNLVRRLVILLSATSSLVVHADGEIAWRHRVTESGVTLTANPLGAEQRTAFYLARGFSAADIRPYTQTCGFSFGLLNGGGRALVAQLADWRAVGADGKTIRLRLPETWEADWQATAVPPAARIAFRWAQFQSTNTFEPGDWIMGMATFATPPPAPFRLLARYRTLEGDQADHEIILDQLACAQD
jgi:hypothetical protein